MDDLREVIARAVYREYENRPIYAQGQMNGILADELADAALAAIKQAGFVVVPAEPTEAMISAGLPIADLDSGHPEDIYRAMIEASNAPT